jgi:environmental stress-induced protein Ves
VDQQLDRPLQMFAFSGDLHIDSMQLGGASYDFNVMTRRSMGRATVTIHRNACQINPAERGLIYIASGQWRLQEQGDTHAELIESQDGLWWDHSCTTLLCSPVSASPAVEPALICVSWSAA